MIRPTLEQILINAAKQAGTMLREEAFEISEVNWKGKDDPVTNLDMHADDIISNELMKFGGTVVSEEHPVWNIDNQPYTWYVDPIDGTKSLIKGQYLSAISLRLYA